MPSFGDRDAGHVLRDPERWLAMPLLILSFVWLGLLIVDLMWELGPVLEGLGTLQSEI